MAYTQHHYQLDYSTIQESISSICKTVLPFHFKKRKGLSSSDCHFSKLQSDNLKWQQESFHQILKLMGLHKEGIMSGSQVSSYRSHLIDTLIASSSPSHHDHAPILRDKLLFLKELYLAKCISEEEYHSSKRPLLQRLAFLGAEIQATDVIVGTKMRTDSNMEEEWSDIELRDEKAVLHKDKSSKRMKHRAALKQIKGAASSVFTKVATSIDHAGSKKQWGFGRKTKRGDMSCEEGDQRSNVTNLNDGTVVGRCVLVPSPVGQGPDTQQMKKKLHPDGSSSDFFIDKVLGERVRTQLIKIQSETNTASSSSSIQLTCDDIETVSTNLPVDMEVLHRLFPKTWCDKYGNVVLDVVRKEFKDHVCDVSRATEGRRKTATARENNENNHPNDQLSG